MARGVFPPEQVAAVKAVACELPARLIHLPVHASWLNQIELYFSIPQRKALIPNDLPTLDALAERILGFGATRPKRLAWCTSQAAR